jgi:hypothetical protein
MFSCRSFFKLQRLSSFRSYSFATDLQLHKEVITESEEAAIVRVVSTVLERKRYETNHWDAVITKYKEVDLGYHLKSLVQRKSKGINEKDLEVTMTALKKIEELIAVALKRQNILFLSPHVIDLAPDGWIGKFSCVVFD